MASTTAPAPEYYPVWKVQSKLAFQDPDMPPGRLHHALFVATDANGGGDLHQVVGDLASRGGMQYRGAQRAPDARLSAFCGRAFLGWTPAAAYPQAWTALLGALPAPPQQKAFNAATRRTEPFKARQTDADGTTASFVFYATGEPRRPLWKCTEWTEAHAVPALYESGLVVRTRPGEGEGEHATDAAVADEPPAAAGGSGWVWDSEVHAHRRFDEAAQEWIWEQA